MRNKIFVKRDFVSDGGALLLNVSILLEGIQDKIAPSKEDGLYSIFLSRLYKHTKGHANGRCNNTRS